MDVDTIPLYWESDFFRVHVRQNSFALSKEFSYSARGTQLFCIGNAISLNYTLNTILLYWEGDLFTVHGGYNSVPLIKEHF